MRPVTFLIATLVATGCQNQATAPAGAPEQSAPPNIVIVFADDLGYGDLGSFGNPYIRTPNLDRLAREGQRWTDFYVAAPVCSPSRGALLTGRLPPRTGLYGRELGVLFPGDETGIPADEITLAEALKSRGYDTTIIGKWHLGSSDDVLPTRHGFDSWLGLPYSNDMDWVATVDTMELVRMRENGQEAEADAITERRHEYYRDPRVDYWNVPLQSSRVTSSGFEDEILERPVDQTTLTKRYTAAAVRYIAEHQDGSPFLLYLPHTMPHTPLFRSDDFVGESLRGLYGDVIEEIDWSVGQVRQALESAGLAETTLLIFTSDNGPWLWMDHHGGNAGPLRHGKGTTFEGGMRVPAIFWWPGTIEPRVVSDIGSTLDVFPTALSLAGAELPDETNIDGLDLSGTLLRGEKSPRASFPFYRGGELFAFRQGAFKLHLVTEGAFGAPPDRTRHEPPLLYHLIDDVGETRNIAAHNPEVVDEIRAAIEKHRAELTLAEPIFDRRLIAESRHR